MGCVSAAHAGYREADFRQNPQEADLRGLKQEIDRARRLSNGRGLVAVNLMVAMKQYAPWSGRRWRRGGRHHLRGGLPLELPGLVGKADVALAPIVSSARAAKLILKTWDKRYGVAPDFLVIEGCKAGGHLGFHEGDLLAGTAQPLEDILPQVLTELAPTGRNMAGTSRLCGGGRPDRSRFNSVPGPGGRRGADRHPSHRHGGVRRLPGL